MKPEVPNSIFKLWAPTPPMGWNSYNCFGANVIEEEVMANAEYQAKHLKRYGWDYVVIDYCWSYPSPPSTTTNNPPQFPSPVDGCPLPWLAMDDYGRLLPDPRRFPSSADGDGFGPLAEYVHSLGLKFGIHVMRGIPWQAVWAKSPVLGVDGITADMISSEERLCTWLNQMRTVEMNRPGAQAYYDSLGALYAGWGVDFIKMDDVDMHEIYHAEEAEAMQRAIQVSERPIVLSLSLNLKLENRDHVSAISNMWRISKDFWDEWELLEAQFEKLHNWNSVQSPGNYPDADMLQLGWISRRGPHGPERVSRFTEEEQMTHMTLWCIAKSPLMMGGDMPDNSDFVEGLLTNEEVIAANQLGQNPYQLYREGNRVVWMSEMPAGNGYFVACFNTGEALEEVEVSLADLGIEGGAEVRDLWARNDLGVVSSSFSPDIPPHGGRLYTIVPG